MSNVDGQLLVINEWIFYNLGGASGKKAQREAGCFLRAFEQSRDKIAVLHGSAWTDKVHDLMEQAGSQMNNPYARTLGLLIRALIEIPNKCIYLYQMDIDDADIPQDAIAAAPRKDLYLIQLYYAAQADLIITADHKFYNAFASRQDLGVNMILRDDFLADYLQQN